MLSNLSGFSILNPKKRRAFQEITGTFNVPEISFASATTSSVVTTITNYDASMTYVVSSSAGSASRVTDTVTVSGLTSNQSVTTTVTATGSTGLEFSSTTPSFPSLPDAPTLSQIDQTTSSVTVTITNYDAGLTYTIGSSAGSASRTGNTITVTGLSAGQTITVTAIASNTSGNSAQGSVFAISEIPAVFESIATITLGGSSTFSFTNIPQTYDHLQLRIVSRGTRSGTLTYHQIRMNGDTTGSYTYHGLRVYDYSVSSEGPAGSDLIYINVSTASGATSGYFGTSIVDILDYSKTNKTKTIRSFGGAVAGPFMDMQAGTHSGIWTKTNAITSIQIQPDTSSFAANSTVALYGVMSQ